MVILTSSGLITDNNIKTARKYVYKTYEKAVIITTASSFKENDKHIPQITEQLSRLGLESICVDIETDSIEELNNYDVMVLGGGNPFYLMKQIQEHNVGPIIEQFGTEKLLIGISAGSIVLGTHMDLIYEFDPQCNDEVHLSSFEGLGLTVNVCPHYDRFQDRYDRFEERIQEVEDKIEAPIYRLNEDTIYIHQLQELSPVLVRLLKLVQFVFIFSLLSVVLTLLVQREEARATLFFQIIFVMFVSSFGIVVVGGFGYWVQQRLKRKTFSD